MPAFDIRPLIVTCDSCGETAETWDGSNPDAAVDCACCPEPHDHMGLGCRTVTITAFAQMTILDAGDLLEALGSEALPPVLQVGERAPEDSDILAE